MKLADHWKVVVSDRVKAPNGGRYFVLNGYFGPERLVRRRLRGAVTEFNPGGDNLWYLLGTPVGTSWQIEIGSGLDDSSSADCVSGSKLVIGSRTEAIMVPAGTFRDVVRVDFRSPCADAGIIAEWFAPGVGLVRRVENSFAGPIVSELVRAEIGGSTLPRLPYSSTLALEQPLYLSNLMPPVLPDAIPTVRGVFAVRNATKLPIVFTFSGCKSISLRVRDVRGDVVLKTGGNDGGCCACDHIFRFELVDDTLVIPFAFKLVTPEGRPLPDGRYSVEAILDTLETGSVHPAASADIEVRSVY
ncbi:MAG: hypothetical protein V3U98_02915 [Acidobacteriota bacterium]